MTISPTIVCNNILRRAFLEKESVSPMKLQKLLYFIACEYQKRKGVPLFSEVFEVWKYGPVLRSVYDEFKSFGKNSITAYAQDAEGISYIVDEATAPILRNAIDRIWDTFKSWDAIPLSNITHRDGSAWSIAYDNHQTVISNEQMGEDVTYECYFSA